MRPRHSCRGRLQKHPRKIIRMGSFNEAPAFLPGKILGRRLFQAQLPVASMRPRHFCRGGSVARAGRRLSKRRFNEAPAFLPGKILRAGALRAEQMLLQ